MNTPALFVLLALIAYFIAYRFYGKWYDRHVWRPDPQRTTPAHMYMDGVEYFPVSKYVLWGYQFKSVAALGPILGPFIALQYGWLPALIWIILGNFFIGWLQDYGAVMVSVRNEGRSFGPISYEFMGNPGRNTLLGFVLVYLLIISATFIYLIAVFFNRFPGTPIATLGVILTGVLVGHLLYKRRMNVGAVTALALVLIVVSVLLGNVSFLRTPQNFLGFWTVPFWAAIAAVFLYLASILPMPTLIQPVNYVSFFPAFAAVILILLGALLSPLTGVTLRQQPFVGFGTFANNIGPLWPMMFVAIACGAISGWHSLVGSSSTSKQLDIETDAHPVGAGAMLSEGMLALASLAAYMVVPKAVTDILKQGNIGAWVEGANLLVGSLFGLSADNAFLTTFFGLVLIIYAITVQALVTRFWRLVSAEVFSTTLPVLGQKHVATFVGLLIPWLFAVTGSWINLWLYFGGSNQLLAGLALMIISIHLARTRAPSIYTLAPATFMIITTLSALAIQTFFFARAVYRGTPITQQGTLLAQPEWAGVALFFNGVFTLVGVALFLLGIRMAYLTYSAYSRYRSEGMRPAPTAPQTA